jgi:hypothetical protein
VERVVEVDHDQAGRSGGDIGVMAAEGDVARAVSTPPSFQVTARLRKLLRGSPSARVSTSTRIRPSSASVTTA